MSMSESSLSQASTKASDDTKDAGNGPRRTLKAVEHARHAATTHDILLFLIALRILNALTLRTFFQPEQRTPGATMKGGRHVDFVRFRPASAPRAP